MEKREKWKIIYKRKKQKMTVYKLTEEQKDLLVGQKWDAETFFNPTLDADGNWFISAEEVATEKAEFAWVKELEGIEHNPIVAELPGEAPAAE
jgi:hypothetical protein